MIILLATGWILVSPAGDAQTSGNYASFSETEISRSHPSYGTAGAIASAVVFSVGVVLSIFSTLSPKAKKIIRFIHGMAGVALCFYGAFTVWTGWVQLGPLKPGVPALDDSPWLWLSFSLFLTVLYLIVLLVRRGRSSSDPNRVSVNEAEKRRSSVFDILITPDQINEMVLQGRIIFVLDNNVFEVPKTFSHPGGRSVLQLHSGQDVGPYMKGFREFQKKSGGNMKRHSHSADAFKLMNKMMIGRLAPMVTSPVMKSQAMTGALPLILTVDMSPLAVPEVSAPPFIPETTKIEGQIISMEIVNKSRSFPVRLFRVETLGHAEIPVGASVHLSSTTSAVERPYTVIRSENNVVEFCIKIYPTGELTSRLNRMKPGMKILLGNVRGRPPIPAIPSPPAMVVFLAGGTGVTPMISFFKDCSKFGLGGYLMWWVRSEEDLFLKRELEDMGAQFGVKVIIFFTEKGDRISLGKILGVFGGKLPVGARDISFVMSGPEGFLKSADDALCELGAMSNRILCLD
jgi:ferredoxin-NADP reductase